MEFSVLWITELGNLIIASTRFNNFQQPRSDEVVVDLLLKLGSKTFPMSGILDIPVV